MPQEDPGQYQQDGYYGSGDAEAASTDSAGYYSGSYSESEANTAPDQSGYAQQDPYQQVGSLQGDPGQYQQDGYDGSGYADTASTDSAGYYSGSYSESEANTAPDQSGYAQQDPYQQVGSLQGDPGQYQQDGYYGSGYADTASTDSAGYYSGSDSDPSAISDPNGSPYGY